jgi:hypothetical protein
MNGDENRLIVPRGPMFRVEQSARGSRRWIWVASMEGGSGQTGCGCQYMDLGGQQWMWMVMWKGEGSVWQPIFFNHWEMIELALRQRLRMAGLEAEVLSCAWPAREVGFRKYRVAIWAEVRRCAPGARVWRQRFGWKRGDRSFDPGADLNHGGHGEHGEENLTDYDFSAFDGGVLSE